MRSLAFVAGIVACGLSSFGAVATADPAGKARADKLFEDGRKYLVGKEYALACTAFEQSQQADPAIGTQLNIALCYEEWGKIASAYRAYLEATRLAKLKFDARAKGSQAKADELAPKVPHVTLEVPDDADVGAVVLFDGKEFDRAKLADDLLVEVGPHVIEVRLSGHPPNKTEIVLKVGERRRIAVDVPKPAPQVVVRTTPRKKGRLYGGLVLTTGGVVAMSVASIVALGARQDYKDAVDHGCSMGLCDNRTDLDATHDARSRANLMSFVGAGGLVLTGVGVYLMLTSAGHRTTERAVTFLPTMSPTTAGLSIAGPL